MNRWKPEEEQLSKHCWTLGKKALKKKTVKEKRY
jgi:hypothetical protein